MSNGWHLLCVRKTHTHIGKRYQQGLLFFLNGKIYEEEKSNAIISRVVIEKCSSEQSGSLSKVSQ